MLEDGDGDTWQSRALREVKESREMERARESTRGMEKAKNWQRLVGESKRKGEGKGTPKRERTGRTGSDCRLHHCANLVNEEKESETEPPRSMASSRKASEVKTIAGNAQFACNNKFEAITEHEHEERT